MKNNGLNVDEFISEMDIEFPGILQRFEEAKKSADVKRHLRALDCDICVPEN